MERSRSTKQPESGEIGAWARGGGGRRSELSNATITVKSLGGLAAGSVLPVIDPSQVAILGIGWIVERRGVAALTLAGDHRVPDRHRGGLAPCRVDTAAGWGSHHGREDARAPRRDHGGEQT
ncbi:2-oxo acid dehydrogenase subunit E2 [Neoroseomonas oryzicola]|uniref:2-oxo acid dehydrogenase subunit E2 n=1 Tax=Neoroseomonas oryzicola TaxID=535904 RepID=A0A9X9WHJ7_9PROT|nr:2-oxo acid dehydrogenase subunit E2 [Neoroseomonas oryzicola]MBR0659807.1 2-oxo acid dehydrogenase subunit E2 [Neoroseomonas oryzicola]NKE19817.1 2-oxo acid dehydrogenase subunit E2 [Neoroseomonas oryzicola]